MRTLTLILIGVGILAGCKDDEPTPVDISMNGTVESGSSQPAFWLAYNGNNKYEPVWSNKYSSTATRSLSISTLNADAADFAYWVQRICTGIPIGKPITLNAKVKGVNLNGLGASIAVRADPPLGNGSPLMFTTTQGKISMTGTFDWTEYSVEMESVPTGTECLYIFLVFLPSTTGEVYFDDVSLTY